MTIEIKIPWEVLVWIEHVENKLVTRIEALEKENKHLKEELERFPSLIKEEIQRNNDPFND